MNKFKYSILCDLQINTQRSLFGTPSRPTKLRPNDPFGMLGTKFILFSYFPTAPLNNPAKTAMNLSNTSIRLHSCTRDDNHGLSAAWDSTAHASSSANSIHTLSAPQITRILWSRQTVWLATIALPYATVFSQKECFTLEECRPNEAVLQPLPDAN